MASVKFEDLVNRAISKGIEPKTRESIEWFKNNIRKVKPSQAHLMKDNKAHLVNSWTNIGAGKFYFFNYDPKHKSTLPYYDLFPMVIPLHKYKDGFLGLNLHYLQPALRVRFLGALYDLENNTDIPERKKLKITYGILKNAQKYRWFRPCIKRYLGKHIRSRFLNVPYAGWDMAAFLPVANFVKASNKKVWKDSIDLINRY